jgi:hypothetical protein
LEPNHARLQAWDDHDAVVFPFQPLDTGIHLRGFIDTKNKPPFFEPVQVSRESWGLRPAIPVIRWIVNHGNAINQQQELL